MTATPTIAAKTVDALVLPRADALSAALVAPSPHAVGPTVLAALSRRIRLALTGEPTSHGLAMPERPRAAGADPVGRCVVGGDGAGDGAVCRRVTGYDLRLIGGAGESAMSEPFTWSPRTARRTIALAAVGALRDGLAAEPWAAVELVLSDTHGAHAIPAGACRDWALSAPRGVRALVRAAATAWATELWTGLAWDLLPPSTLVGPPDRWWRPGPRSRVVVRGRADVRTETADGRQAALCVLPGQPCPQSALELALVGLVDGLARGASHVPARVVGWWPECGRTRVVTIDADTLEAAATGVIAVTVAPPRLTA